MSGPSSFSERMVLDVLAHLWRSPETTMQAILRQTLHSVPDIQHALTVLRDRGCLLEISPTHIHLERIGLGCYRDLIEMLSRENHWRLGRKSQVFQCTASTNDVAWSASADAANDGLVVFADEQTAGRGRRGNHWQTPPGQSILVSILLTNVAVQSVERLTLLAGLATARASDGITGMTTAIKWPNDVLVDGKKLAGVLVEKRGDNLVIGIGLNVLQAAGDFDPAVAHRATSLFVAAKKRFDRCRVLVALLDHLNTLLAQPGDAWLADWKARCSMLGRPVRVLHDGVERTGQVLDVDPLAGLIVRDSFGVTHLLPSATTTVVPD